MEEIKVNLDNLTQEEREQLLKLVEKGNTKKYTAWKPEIDEVYYCATPRGIIDFHTWINDPYDNNYYLTGNCFKTPEEAEFYKEELLVMAELKRLAGSWKHDFTPGTNQQKYFLYDYFSIDKNKYVIGIDYNYELFYNSSDYLFESKEDAQKAINSIGEERLLKYFFKVPVEEKEDAEVYIF